MKTLSLLFIGLLFSGMSYSQLTVKKVSVLILLVLFSTTINSQTLDDGMIKSIAQNWANSHSLNPKIANIICKTVDDEPLLYIVNFVEGWVMISADESLETVLGFSFDSNYSGENEADGVKSLFEFYSSVKKENITNNIKFTKEREALLSGNYKSTNTIEKVEPLLPVSWSQGWPYNAYCPLDSDMPESFNGHHNTSCGPTAFAQILRYWRYPVHGTGYHSYTYDHPGFALLGFVEADYESTYYNWDNMPASLNSDDPESVYTDIATLMQNVGVSVDGSWSSGGQLFQYSAAAVKYFNYSPTCEVYYRNDFTTEEWHNLFRNDLDNGRPIMMVGPGHYFVCDGYYGSDFYHINWGWGPGSDGYYPLYHLGNYGLNNWALIGLEPNYQDKKLKMNDPYTVDDNTVVLLHFDGDLTNQSTLSNNPNEHGTIAFADNSELGLGQCLYLDNTSQENQSFLDIANNNNLNLSEDWTIEMWFKPTSLGTNGYENFTLLNKPGDNSIIKSNYSILMLPATHWLSPEGLNFSFYPSGEPERYKTSINTDGNFLELGKWYHISYFRNSTTNTLKVVIHNSDKELIYYASRPTETTELPLLNSNPLFIGSSNRSNTYFDGYIDELRISNIVREFEITGSGLTLSTPNGGEKWEQNTIQQIRWEDNTSDNLKIEYSSDNEQNWNEIISSTPASTGFYNWTLPNIDSDRCKIKLTDINDANVYDKSDGIFSILPYKLTLKSPNESNFYVPGEEVLITWENTPVSNIKIEYTSNNGTSWIEVAASIDSRLGIFNWIIPNTISNQCKIKITDITNAAVSDESDNTFEIGIETITSIYDIQYTTEAGTDGIYPSLINGEEVTTIGIVTAIGYLGNDNTFFISEQGRGAWGAINIYKSNVNPTIGDEVKVIGTVTEYNGFTEIINSTTNILSSGNQVPDPIVINTSDLTNNVNAEQFESCLVKVENVTVSKAPDAYNQIFVDDGSGECQVDDPIYNYSISLGEQFEYIIGVVDYKYNKYRLIPRLESDFLSLQTGIHNSYLNSNLFTISPNPAADNILISSPEIVNLSIFSLTGQKIIERKNFLNGNIDVSGLNKGIYVIRFSGSKGIVSKKLIIE